MTDIPLADDQVEAREDGQAGRFLLTVFLACFFMIGWFPGRCWLLLADGAVAMRLGYRRGRGLPPEEAPPA